MPRARNVKPALFANEYLAELPPETRLLFIGLWTLADRRGRLEDRPKGIKGKLFPYDDFNVNAMLQELADSPERFIIRYKCDGKQFIQVTNFEKHQNPHIRESESTIPPPAEYQAANEKASDEYETSTVLASDMHQKSPADSFNLIPDSLKLISDSCVLPSAQAPTPVKLLQVKLGQYGWVHITTDQYSKLISDLGETELNRCIQYIDEAAQSSGNKNKWKDWNLIIRRCSRENWGKSNQSEKIQKKYYNNQNLGDLPY